MAIVQMTARLMICWRTLAMACLLACLVPMPANAQAQRVGPPYFVEFRARETDTFGHSVVVYGHIDAYGRMTKRNFVSLHPIGDKGLIFPARAWVGPSAEDIHSPPVASYRRPLTAAQYARVAGTVRRMKANWHIWHAAFINCNDLSIQVADTIGLRRPHGVMPPSLWVHTLRAMNNP